MVVLTTLALMFGWICGTLTVQITDSIGWSFVIAALCGVSWGVAERTWERGKET